MSGTVILLLISMYRCSLNLSPNTPAHQPKFVQDGCVCVFARISKVQLHVRDVINKTAQSAYLSRREKPNRSNIHLICAGLRAYNWQPQQQLTTNSLKHCTTLSCLLYLSISRSFSPLHTQSDFLQIDGTSIQGREKKKNNVGCVYNIYTDKFSVARLKKSITFWCAENYLTFRDLWFVCTKYDQNEFCCCCCCLL